MKKSIASLILLSVISYDKTSAQSTQTGIGFLGHSPLAGGVAVRYLGWDASPAANAIPLRIDHRGTNRINIFTGPTQRMTILGTASGPNQGFVGIGANYATPNNLLDVNGGDIDVNTATRSYMLNNQSILWHKGSNTNLFVGVQAGQAHPLNSLAENTFVGYRSGFNCLGFNPPTNAVRNTFVGVEAGFGTTTAAGATYVGYRAGYSHNQAINLNTCVGYECGFANQDGDNAFYGALAARNFVNGAGNCVFGQIAGFNMNLSNNCTFMGLGAGFANIGLDRNNFFGENAGAGAKGSDNVFIGNQAGLNGIGTRNVVVGNFGMTAATTGTDNVIIGHNANLVTPGTSFNTIIGSQAAIANINGASNTFVGFQSALAQTTGTGNVYVGLESGDNMVGGSGNTFLGIRAGATNANSALLNAAAIGAGAQVTNNNHMILGNNAVNVGIGLSSDPTGPQNKLEINTAAPTSIPGASGLRFRDLTNISTAIANPGPGILSVDANGDVIYVQGPPPSVFGGVCGTNPLALSNNWEIPMATFNYVYTGQGINQTNVGIGTGCVPNAKLQVQQSSGSVLGSIGINVDNDDLTPCFSNDYVIGLKATANLNNAASTISGLYRVAGWFEAPVSNGCGLINNFALYTPQNGGFISFGYPTPSTNGGLLNVNGVTWSSGGYTSSDVTLKNTVTTLPNSLNKIKSLRPVTFKWNTVSDSLMNGTHAGFIAQEVDTVIPQVVRTNGSGVKSVAYSELIPYLVSAIQAQQQQIKQMDSLITLLTQSISSCCSNSAAKQTGIEGNDPKSLSQINVNLSDVDMIVLNQNVPNPFAEQTTITYNVPEKYSFAQLVFKTIDGKIIKTVDITKKGRGQVNVFANDLSNGLYMYSLIVDGTSVDTKKMVKQN